MTFARRTIVGDAVESVIANSTRINRCFALHLIPNQLPTGLLYSDEMPQSLRATVDTYSELLS